MRPIPTNPSRVAASPGEVASTAEIVLMSLPTPDVVKAVTLGENALGPRDAAADRRVDPGHRAVAEALRDEPGDARPTFDSTVEPILKTFGKVFYTGDKPGLAQTAKLVNKTCPASRCCGRN
jgi:3-hydroxyisobutyrate dehydrogenase-like beta-hydroxyacid dehydrogenase